LPLLARSMQRENRLLLLALDRDRLDPRRPERLEDRFAIGPVRLVPLPIRLDVLRGQERHLVAQADQMARPVMRTAACLHRHGTRLASAPEALELGAGHSPPLDDSTRAPLRDRD